MFLPVRTLLTSAVLCAVLVFPAFAGSGKKVVIELLTSQGCSSCPPADAYLAELAKRDDIIALSFHVDYWNYIGWTDPFSSPDASTRQRADGRTMGKRYVYTPQVVVDGRAETVGSNRSNVNNLIRMAAAAQKIAIAIDVALHKDGTADIHVPAEAAQRPRRTVDRVLRQCPRNHGKGGREPRGDERQRQYSAQFPAYRHLDRRGLEKARRSEGARRHGPRRLCHCPAGGR